MDLDQFGGLLAASPKKFREELFRRAGIRVKGDTFSLKSGHKNEIRAQKLHEALRQGVSPGEEIVGELIRNYLYTRRSMLSDALDYLKVPHEGGLTDADLDFLGSLTPDRVSELRTLLEARYDSKDVDLYFVFMNIPTQK